MEFPGQGPQHQLSSDDWSQVSRLFENVRKDLLGWLKEHRKRFGSEIFSTLESRIRELKLARMPAMVQPDIAWRGVGVLTQDAGGAPMLELGSGFVKLLETQPERAKFELTRLAAQAWEPCGLLAKAQPSKDKSVEQPWGAFLRCMKIDTAQACGSGQFSEAGWAVSTALAYQVSKPDCRIAAFSDPGFDECPKKFLAPLTLMSSN